MYNYLKLILQAKKYITSPNFCKFPVVSEALYLLSKFLFDLTLEVVIYVREYIYNTTSDLPYDTISLFHDANFSELEFYLIPKLNTTNDNTESLLLFKSTTDQHNVPLESNHSIYTKIRNSAHALDWSFLTSYYLVAFLIYNCDHKSRFNNIKYFFPVFRNQALELVRVEKIINLFKTGNKSFSSLKLLFNKMFALFPIYTGVKSFILPMFFAAALFIILLDYYNINFLRQLGVWFVVGIIFFLLMSGFNFFLKRYRFGKFTSALQRFWKRTNAYFWIVEGFLFFLFFYYYLNSSQDVIYFSDEASLTQNFLTNLSSFYFSSCLSIFLIFYALYVMLNFSNFTFRQGFFHLTLITVFFIYGFLLESYQFYYVITGFFEYKWEFDDLTKVWSLEEPEVDKPTWTRPKLQYFTLALIAKYWHFLVIFISWVFMIFKFYEQKSFNYVLVGFNIQNYMLLFILNILFNVNWLKWLLRRYLDNSYFWFFTDFNQWGVYIYLKELCKLCADLF